MIACASALYMAMHCQALHMNVVRLELEASCSDATWHDATGAPCTSLTKRRQLSVSRLDESARMCPQWCQLNDIVTGTAYKTVIVMCIKYNRLLM